jgi:histidine ammonia-lyase
MEKKILLTGENLSIEDVWAVAHQKACVELSEESIKKIQKSRDYIESRINAGEVMYGVNTGFGAFSSVRISDTEIEALQRNLIRSHSMGVGPSFHPTQVRAIMLLRANALSRGHSGVRVEVVQKILEFLKHDILPMIPQQGSVGASGDLAPLSHLALSLMGEGDVLEVTSPDDFKVSKKSCAEILREKNISPLTLKAKEGLSLINGCQVMTAVGMLAAYQARRVLWMMDIAGAMTLEALRGSRTAFHPLIAATRPHPGEAKTASNLRALLSETSSIAESHAGCNKVQDAYSLRCMPAVHGAAKDALRYVWNVLQTESNSSTDNPLVFADHDEVLSCGNFHGEPVAFALDFAAIAMSGSSSMSECRIEKLINPAMSDLPAFLAPQGGLHSGHMIVQVAAASLVSENKILSHPASVDSIPTSADKEDHVSMGTIASRKFSQVVANAENIVAMELLSATQALDLLRPLRSSKAIEKVYDLIRTQIPFAKEDRIFSKDVQCLRQMIQDGSLLKTVENIIGDLSW